MAMFTYKQMMDCAAGRKALASHMVKPQPEGPRRPKPPMMNGLEQKYAAVLNLRKAAGEIRQWWFNAMKLRIAVSENSTAIYTGDFLVWFADGHLEVHETKGHERQRGILAFKCAASLYPCFRFVLVKLVDGHWEFETF